MANLFDNESVSSLWVTLQHFYFIFFAGKKIATELKKDIFSFKQNPNWGKCRAVSGRHVTCDVTPHRWATWRRGRGSEDLGRKRRLWSPSSSVPGCHPHLSTQDHITAQHFYTTELLRKLAGEAASVRHSLNLPALVTSAGTQSFLERQRSRRGRLPALQDWSESVGSRLLASAKKIKMSSEADSWTAGAADNSTLPRKRALHRRVRDGWQLEVVVQNGAFADSSTRRILGIHCIHCQKDFFLCVFWLINNVNICWLFVAVPLPPPLQMFTGLGWNLARKLLRFGLRNSFSTQSKCFVWRCASLTNGNRHYCIIVSIKEA